MLWPATLRLPRGPAKHPPSIQRGAASDAAGKLRVLTSKERDKTEQKGRDRSGDVLRARRALPARAPLARADTSSSLSRTAPSNRRCNDCRKSSSTLRLIPTIEKKGRASERAAGRRADRDAWRQETCRPASRRRSSVTIARSRHSFLSIWGLWRV